MNLDWGETWIRDKGHVLGLGFECVEGLVTCGLICVREGTLRGAMQPKIPERAGPSGRAVRHPLFRLQVVETSL